MSFDALMANVFLTSGCVTMKMIVETEVMKQLVVSIDGKLL